MGRGTTGLASAPAEGGPGGLPSAPASPSYRRALANRSFLIVWLSQLISQSGDFVFEVALIWLVLKGTGSAFAVAVVVAGTILPGVVLGPFLGVYVDRWDRRRTLLATNVLEGAVVAVLSGLVLAHATDLAGLFLIVVVLGAGARTVAVATGALVPTVVGVDDLPPANGLLSLTGSMNQVLGLSIGGVAVAVFGVAAPIEYDALTFFLAAALLLRVPGTVAPAGAPTPAPGRFREEFREGLRFIREHRFLLEIIAIGVLVNFFGNGLAALFAPYASFVLHGNAAIYGALGASVAAGSFVGAAAIGRANLRRSAGRYLFAGGVLLGPILFAVGLTHVRVVAFALLFAFGVALSVTNVPIFVALQAKVPNRLLGRVQATFLALVVAAGPAGPIFAGWLAQRWSVGTVFLLSGAVITAVLGVAAATMTTLRRLAY